MRQLYSGQLLTSITAGTVLVVRDFDRLRRLINNLVGINDLVSVVLTGVPEVSTTVGDGGMPVVELSTATVADVFLDLFIVGHFGNRLCGVMLHPIVVVNRF